MLYFLSHLAPKDYPRLKVKKGSSMCKVFADSPEELFGWGGKHGLRTPHVSRNGKPHYDLWGPRLVLCPESNEMRRHREIYRIKFRKGL
jgi:hypothetical protein